MREQVVSLYGSTLLFDATLTNVDELAAMFANVRGIAAEYAMSGRGTVYFVKSGDQEWALREYRRGGLVGKFIARNYCYLGLNQTRMAREFRLLSHLYRQGLPVPRPVVARIFRSTLVYRGALVTQRLPGTQTLGNILKAAVLDQSRWTEVGQCIRRFHDHGVYHADLNANNIMLDDQQVYLIDFDKGRLLDPDAASWKKSNLVRLRRSLDKLRTNTLTFHFGDRDWQYLLLGYEEATASSANLSPNSER
ncbi:MAG: 3-deoxy-D-manno-octulosonic acid kinase [Halieaceae bacterium]|jgi:3-deoxy-D-manno-octulosonic acid kinase|nr:3-deoxy-D-manno-octulosonic acid kinase [Halieaceae bacterium]